VDVNEVVRGLEDLLRVLVGHAHRLEVALEPGVAPVAAAAAQLEHALVTLVLHARDTMPGPGVLRVTTAEVEVDGARRPGRLPPGRYVTLAVSEAGGGADPEGAPRPFESEALGYEVTAAGLRLFTVNDIVERNGGEVRVSSDPGRGSTFRMYLPGLRHDFRPDDVQAGAGGAATGRETVLVVEDEREVRELIHDVLRLHGYTVLVAASGDEALGVLDRHSGPVHLMIVDLVMPGTSGQELVRQVTATRADIKAIYVSGYTDDVIRQHGLLRVGRDFLQKPFTVDDLAHKVREVLDSA
jgi:CheY-like chemotaxis protein